VLDVVSDMRWLVGVPVRPAADRDVLIVRLFAGMKGH
jgi:hypothetical protein